MLDGTLFGGQSEKQLVKASDVFPRLCRAVLRHILREREHQRLAVVQDIDFLPLRLRKAERAEHRTDGHERTRRNEDDPEQAYLLKRGFDILQ